MKCKIFSFMLLCIVCFIMCCASLETKKLTDNGKDIYRLIEAGDKSKKLYDNNQAIEYYNQALKLIKTEGVETTLLGHIYQSLGEIYFFFARYEDVLEYCRKALDHTIDKKDRANIYGLMGWTYEREGNSYLALKHAKLGITELENSTESPEMAWISISLFWPTLYDGNTAEAIKIAQRGIEIGEKTENNFAVAQLYIGLLFAYMEPSYNVNEMDKGFECAKKSVEAALKSGDIYSIKHSNFWLGWAYMRKGDDETAIRLMKDSIEFYKKTNLIFHLNQSLGWLSEIYMRKGDLKSLNEISNLILEYEEK